VIAFCQQASSRGDPFDPIDEITQTRALNVTPTSWLIGLRPFFGTYDLFADKPLLSAV
jgi:peptide subunit release factor RF-3